MLTVETAIGIHNALENNENVKQYLEALHFLVHIEDYDDDFKEKTELYKEGNNYQMIIVLPYKEIEWSSPCKIRQGGYDGKLKYTDKQGKKHEVHLCRGLCNYSKEKIVQSLEKYLKDLVDTGELELLWATL